MTRPPEILPVALRAAQSTDMGLVYDSWLKSYRFKVEPPSATTCKTCGRHRRRDVSGGEANGEMATDDYFRLQRRRIDSLLRSGAFVMVAYPVGTPNVIWAWACLDIAPSVLHYVYTVAHCRERGYAKLLVGDRRVCTHLTDSRRPDSFAAWKRRMGMRYLPHLLDAA